MEPIQYARHAETRQRAVHFDGDTLPREIVHDVERAEAAAIGERIDREIHRPAGEALIGHRQRTRSARVSRFRWRRRTCSGRAIDAMHAFVIDDESLALEQDVQAPITKPRPHGRMRVEPLRTATFVALVRR